MLQTYGDVSFELERPNILAFRVFLGISKLFPRGLYSFPGQLSLAIPPWVGAMSTSKSWDVNRDTARCTSPAFVVWQCKLVSG